MYYLYEINKIKNKKIKKPREFKLSSEIDWAFPGETCNERIFFVYHF